MENLPTNPPEHSNARQEIVPISEARYLDRLDDSFEDAWQLIIANIDAAGQGDCVPMRAIWEDPEMPQVFRDRAMLVSVGSSTARQQLGKPSSRGSGRQYYVSEDAPGPRFFKLLPGESLGEAYAWLDGTFWHQKTSGNELLAEHSLLYWWCDMFENRVIDQAQFEEYLSNIDVIGALPTTDYNDYPMDPGRFPLLTEIFDGPRRGGFGGVTSYGGEQVEAWARQTLQTWLQSRTSEEVAAPKWCENVSESAGLKAYITLFQKNQIGYADLRPAIKYFGWEHFAYQRRGKADWLNKLQSINPDGSADTEMLYSLVTHIFEQSADDMPQSPHHKQLFSHDSEYHNLPAIAAQLAELYQDASMKARIEREYTYRDAQAALYATYQEQQRQKQARQAEAALQSPEYKAQLAAQHRIAQLITHVKQLPA